MAYLIFATNRLNNTMFMYFANIHAVMVSLCNIWIIETNNSFPSLQFFHCFRIEIKEGYFSFLF